MITKNQIKYFASLQKKKSRDEEGVFLVEGHRSVLELFQSALELKMVVATKEWFEHYSSLLPPSVENVECVAADMGRMSAMQTPPQVMACVKIPSRSEAPLPQERLILVLDTVQDPGNLGTIIRTADWFGINSVVCSHDSADVYAPKVVQSSMGALGRVSVYYTDLTRYLGTVNSAGLPIYGTLLDGSNMYGQELSQEGAILLGNEGNGISPALLPFVSQRLFIPAFPSNAANVESLNVAIAAAIVCAEFRRRFS